MPRYNAVVGGARSQNLHDGREEKQLQDLRCRAEERDWAVGVVLVSRFPRFQYWYDDGVLSNCRNVNSRNRMVVDLRQEGYDVLT